jgi:Ca-activated chloride channel family protein
MRRAWFGVLAVAGAVSAATAAGQAPELRIISPGPDTIVSGPTRVEVAIEPQTDVKTVTITVNGRQVCSAEQLPYECTWDAGPAVRGQHIRVVARLLDGRRVVANVHTKDLGYTERVDTEAVLVPVIVTDGGHFVRGLKRQDFQVFEDGVAQPVESFVAEDAPLDLVLAIDVSGSMEAALPNVKPAVKQLLSKLRPGDAATLLGFNDTTFLAAEREKDQKTRENAVDLLTSWGGTALYDATIKALELVSREWGRKGLVLFSDGDDRHSLTRRETAMARVQASDAMLYSIGFGGGATVPHLRASLESYARATGGRAFFPNHVKELDNVFDQIVTELANQYVLSYSPTNVKKDGKWRDIKVQVRNGKYNVRARKGYQASGPQRAGR